MNEAITNPGAGRVENLDGGRMVVASEYAALLRGNGLDTFDAVMGLPAKDVIRSFPGRNTVRLELKDTKGGDAAVYLKRYDRSYLSAWKFLLRLLRWPGAEDEAMREWGKLVELRAKGFKVPIPVSAGQEKSGGAVVRSFVMTAEIEGGVCAHDKVPSLTREQQKTFARDLAELMKRFHEAGYVHKDFYLYHVFLTAGPDAGEIVLIDLQRVVQPIGFQRRLQVKDLAALAYSALKIGVPRTDLVRFYRAYRAKAQFDEGDHELARDVLNRVAWLNQRVPKHDKNFEPMTKGKV